MPLSPYPAFYGGAFGWGTNTPTHYFLIMRFWFQWAN